jgi:membrane protein YqaA with SNARE-associated domain
VTEILNWILASIRAYGPWSVFAGVIIESVIVPIPSPLIIMGAGFVLIDPNLTFLQALAPIALQIVLPGAVASTLGAYIGYGIGYGGGKPMVDRWEKFLGFSWRDVEPLEQRFRGGRVNTSIFLLRALPIFPLSVISATSITYKQGIGQNLDATKRRRACCACQSVSLHSGLFTAPCRAVFFSAISAGAWEKLIRPWPAASTAWRVSFQLCWFSGS